MISSSKMWSPAAFAFALMALIAALYEPLRLSLLHNVSINIGGVGGVGGLANMLGAGDDNCANGTKSYANSTFHDNYCYENGVNNTPFTPFAWIMIVVWVGPLFLAAIVTTLLRLLVWFSDRSSSSSNRTARTSNTTTSSPPLPLGVLAAVWIGMNILWFIIPCVVFWFGVRIDVEGSPLALKICAVAIAASHPLSWNLMAASIPASGITSKLLLGEDNTVGVNDSRRLRDDMFKCHRFISYCTVFWGLIHGVLELVYFSMKKELAAKLLMREDGEDVLYLIGVIVFILILTQGVVGYGRAYIKKKTSVSSFRSIHRGLALALLLAAAVHWWPFVVFLIPAVSLHSVGLAAYYHSTRLIDHDSESDKKLSLCNIPDKLSRTQVSMLVSLSILSSFVSTYLIWVWRQMYMTSSSPNLAVPFLFPLLCIVCSFITSTIVSVVFIKLMALMGCINNGGGVDATSTITQDHLMTPLMQVSEGDDELENGI